MNERKKIEIKHKIKNTSKKTWSYVIVISSVILLIIGCLILAMYLSGYTLATWFSKYYQWFIVSGAILIAIIFTIWFFKERKKRN